MIRVCAWSGTSTAAVGLSTRESAHYTFKRQAACRKRRASCAESRRRRHLRFARAGGPRTLTREWLPDPSAGAGGAPREPRLFSSCVRDSRQLGRPRCALLLELPLSIGSMIVVEDRRISARSARNSARRFADCCRRTLFR